MLVDDFVNFRLPCIFHAQPLPLPLRLPARAGHGLRDLALARLVVVIPLAGEMLAHLGVIDKLRHVLRQFFLRTSQQGQTTEQQNRQQLHRTSLFADAETAEDHAQQIVR